MTIAYFSEFLDKAPLLKTIICITHNILVSQATSKEQKKNGFQRILNLLNYFQLLKDEIFSNRITTETKSILKERTLIRHKELGKYLSA